LSSKRLQAGDCFILDQGIGIATAELRRRRRPLRAIARRRRRPGSRTADALRRM